MDLAFRDSLKLVCLTVLLIRGQILMQKLGPVWYTDLNTCFQFLNNIICISFFFFIHTYIHTYFQFLNACTKHPLRLQNFYPSSLTHESVGMIGWWRCLMLMYWIYIISLIMCKSYTIVHCKRENTCIRCILNIYFRHMLTIII